MNIVKPSCLKASMYINFPETKPANTLTHLYLPSLCLQKGIYTCCQGLPLDSCGGQAPQYPVQGWTIPLEKQGLPTQLETLPDPNCRVMRPY